MSIVGPVGFFCEVKYYLVQGSIEKCGPCKKLRQVLCCCLPPRQSTTQVGFCNHTAYLGILWLDVQRLEAALQASPQGRPFLLGTDVNTSIPLFSLPRFVFDCVCTSLNYLVTVFFLSFSVHFCFVKFKLGNCFAIQVSFVLSKRLHTA